VSFNGSNFWFANLTLPALFGRFVTSRMAPESSKPVPDDGSATAPQHPRRDRMTDEEDTIELGWYLRSLRRRWKLAAAGVLIGGALGFGYASNQPLLYEGVTTLLIVPPSQSNAPQMNPATFRPIVENASLASEVISELKLGAGADALTPLKFVEDALQVEEVRGTNIVRVRVTLHDPKIAAEASGLVAGKAIALTQQISQQSGASTQGQLKGYVTGAQERLTKAETALLSYKQGAQVELLKEDSDAQLKERGDLLRLVVNIEAEKARLGSALTEIKQQRPLLTNARMPATEEALRRAAADAKTVRDKDADLNSRNPGASRGEADSQHLDLSNPYVNPVYQTLDFQIAQSRTRIAALEKERDELVIVKKIGGKELALLSELYRRQIEQARLQANFDLATRIYDDLAFRFEQSRTQPVGSTAQLQIIDNALPAERPVSRRRAHYATYGALAGLVLSVMLIPLWENRA
jgi:uncharacterized protein involved in exopolysaccharide biosynthesis